jgi:hypothetical protein
MELRHRHSQWVDPTALNPAVKRFMGDVGHRGCLIKSCACIFESGTRKGKIYYKEHGRGLLGKIPDTALFILNIDII